MLNKYITSFKYVIWNSINFVAMSVSSFYALYYINIPIFLAVRRCQSLFVVIIYLFICWSHKLKAKIVISSLICTLSTLICIYEDWENGNIYGYLALITLNTTCVIFLEYSKYLMNKIQITQIEMLNHIGFNAMIINLIVIYSNGDLFKAIDTLKNQYS